jgi:hypothetical protein
MAVPLPFLAHLGNASLVAIRHGPEIRCIVTPDSDIGSGKMILTELILAAPHTMRDHEVHRVTFQIVVRRKAW